MIVWSTDSECMPHVNYGTDSSYALSRNGSSGISHEIVLSGLAQDTTYYYRAQCTVGNITRVAGYGSFRTAYTYESPVQSPGGSENGTVIVNVTEVSTIIEMNLNDAVDNGSLNITYSTSNPVGMTMSVAELGRFVRIEASSDVREALTSVMLKVYYTDEELEDANINESSLAMYWYNETAGSWIKLSTDLDWVYGTGVNMQDNYVWANVSYFSDYTAGGDSICTLKGDFPTCSYVTLQEVVNYINKWAGGRAELDDVINLIDGWTATDA